MTDQHAPAPTSAERSETLTIRQETKVGWFDVRQLCATAAKAVASTVVGSMSGRREVLAALDRIPLEAQRFEHSYAAQSDVWIDYVADSGDGWDATYSVAYLVGRDAIYLRNDGEPTPQPISASGAAEPAPLTDSGITALPFGRILMLGGDQVYPTASAAAYQGRLQDPYQCARPEDEEVPKRDVYAIPGNHDWYDGLTSFIRLFCQAKRPRSIGTWKTRQRRSYFAICLREGWWLWAADLALEDDMDPPQRDYFTDQAGLLQKDDRVILCLPAPTWAEDVVAPGQQDTRRQTKKTELLEDQIKGTGARVVLTLAGDLHHYARHEAGLGDDVSQYIICGGGGAFTLGTSRQPQSIDLPDGRSANLKKAFPSDAESRAMRWWALLFPLFSTGFTALLVGYLLALLYFFHEASHLAYLRPNTNMPLSLLVHMSKTMSWAELPELILYVVKLTRITGITILLTIAFIGGCILFARSGNPPDGSRFGWFFMGSLHGLLQLVSGLVCCWLAIQVALLSFAFGETLFIIAFVMLSAALIFIVNGVLFGVYLLISNIAFGLHEQEVFSCQSIEKFKCFLRIRIEGDRATVYPIGLRRPGRKWKPAPGVKLESSAYTATFGLEAVLTVPSHTKRIYDPGRPLSPHLIEPPIVVR